MDKFLLVEPVDRMPCVFRSRNPANLAGNLCLWLRKALLVRAKPQPPPEQALALNVCLETMS